MKTLMPPSLLPQLAAVLVLETMPELLRHDTGLDLVRGAAYLDALATVRLEFGAVEEIENVSYAGGRSMALNGPVLLDAFTLILISERGETAGLKKRESAARAQEPKERQHWPAGTTVKSSVRSWATETGRVVAHRITRTPGKEALQYLVRWNNGAAIWMYRTELAQAAAEVQS